MTNHEIPNPMPQHAMILDDNGLPSAVVDFDVITSAATRLMYDMAANSGDETALEQISARYIDEVGVDTFGYVTAAALKLMTTCVLEPTLQVVDEALPTIPLRAKLADAAHNANNAL
ncbi:hypothetical protein GTA09_15330 [Rhodococcus hoagii]|nr:hypothetical protein [Prescottella equi]NKZ71067.1 hypothetical protein [Prescottella equi]